MTDAYQPAFDRAHGIHSIVDTLGGHEVTQIFVHDVAAALKGRAEFGAAVTGFERYAERALIAARPDDLVCVRDTVDEDGLRFLRRLGVGPGRDPVVGVTADASPDALRSLSDMLADNREAPVTETLRTHKRIVVNPFMLSSSVLAFVSALQIVCGRSVQVLGGSLQTVNAIKQKHYAKARAAELGVPVPEGESLELELGDDGKVQSVVPLREAILRGLQKTNWVIVKGTYGVSGSSLMIIRDQAESLDTCLDRIAKQGEHTIYLVEAMLPLRVSPNVGMYIEPREGSLSCVGVTDQILTENLAHEGNSYPSSAKTLKEMVRSARTLSRWLQAQGYSGFVGFDFGEYWNPDTQRFEHFLAEVNPRINAAAYPTFLLDHLNRRQRQDRNPTIEAFLALHVRTQAKSFAELAECCGDLFFNPASGKGLVPYNTGGLAAGHCSLAVFGHSRRDVRRLYERFRAAVARPVASSTPHVD